MLSAGMAAQQRQSPRLIPQQITFNTVLEMNAAQLHQHVQAELAENPALSLVELPSCSVCGAPMESRVCWECGATPGALAERTESLEDSYSDYRTPRSAGPGDEEWDPLSVVAAAWDLRDELRVQLGVRLTGEALEVGEFLVESLDDDGYFKDDLIDVADRFLWSVPEVEAVLAVIQTLDPPGIAARNLQECLVLQLRRATEQTEVTECALRVVSEAFGPFCGKRFDRVAKQIGVTVQRVAEVADYIRGNLAPCPARNFRVFWQGLTPAQNRSLTPDVSLRFEGEKLVAESVEFRSWRLQLEAQYLRLDQAMRIQRARFSTEDRQHVRLYMGRARALTDALVQRRRTLERVTLFIGEVQRDFLVDGPEMLKPLTKKQVSQAMGLHESTICRATLHKYVQLPNGEVTSFDTFFDGSLSPKEVIRRIIAQEPPQKPLSDGEIAKRMGMAGFQLARRTIAKYRDALGVPAMELRRRP